MKIIILNRRRIGVTLIILGLMAILFSVERSFDEKLKDTLMYSNLGTLKTYQALNVKISYKLPEDWTTSVEKANEKEILYYNNFISKDQQVHGIIQVWNRAGDLKVFLDNSKDSTFNTGYNISPIKLNNHDGYIITYLANTGNENYYKSYEYYFQDKNRFYKFSFYVNEKAFKETMPLIFNSIVKTLEYKE
jgi:hypothetical protein